MSFWSSNNTTPCKSKPVRKSKPACRCREPKRSRDCAYCGVFPSGQVCGVCHEAGIDGPVLRGTSRVVCAQHKK